jgi:hypothetical protein
MKSPPLSIAATILATCLPAAALDHKILDEGRPLRLEDPYTKGHGEFTFEAGFRLENNRGGRNQAVFPLAITYGLFPNFHLELETEVFSSPRDVQGPHGSGDLHLAGQYNFNVETMTLPALGVKVGAGFPSGSGSRGTDIGLKGMVTKTFGGVSLHFNAGYEWFGSPDPGMRDGVYQFAFGPSFPIGAPMHTRTTVLADVFLEQSHTRGGRDIVGVEAGVRYQLTEWTVLDAGLGTEFRGPAERTSFFAAIGITRSF